MPVGYGLSLVGLLIFVVGGVGDLLWHELFGFEHDLEALLSPSHLVLALSGALMVAGPFRSAWHRPDVQSPPSLGTQWPMLVSMALLLSLFTFFTQFAHPLVETWLMQDTPRSEVYGEIFAMGAGWPRPNRESTPVRAPVLSCPCRGSDLANQGGRVVTPAHRRG